MLRTIRKLLGEKSNQIKFPIQKIIHSQIYHNCRFTFLCRIHDLFHQPGPAFPHQPVIPLS